MEALGIDPKDADPNDLYFTRFDTFDESLSDRDKKRLNTFPTTSNAIQIVTQNKHGVSLYDTDSITNNLSTTRCLEKMQHMIHLLIQPVEATTYQKRLLYKK